MENLFTVGKIFSDRIFCVPDYQRGYAWEQRQCQDFIEDLELLGEGREHFLGLLILHARDGDSAKILDQRGRAYEVYDVVDGQQRLTTLVVFLHAMQKEMMKYGSLQMLAEGLEETYLLTHDLNGQPLPKLTLNRDTHTFFYDTVLERSANIQGPTIRSHQFLAGAKEHFATYLRQKRSRLKDAFPDWLKAQYLKVTQHLTFVVYTVRSEADAGVVFETMNNRGKELTELEKVKNYLLYLASKLELPTEHDLSDDINDTWTHIFERLMAANLSDVRDEDRLLRAHWLMAYDYDRRRWEGSRSVKSRFNLGEYKDEHLALLEDLKDYLRSLRNATVAYCDVFRPSHPNAFGSFNVDAISRTRLVAAGERLVRLDALVTFLPLLMAARIRHPDDGAVYLEALELCERFAFRVYRWRERPAYTGQSWLFRLGNQLFGGREVKSVLNELLRAILYYCPDSMFENRFEQENLNWYRWPGLKYMLYEYEQHLANAAGQPVKMPWETLTRKADTVEHILPQALEAGGYWSERFTTEKHHRWVHDIGNLTLTFDNSILGTKPFPAKKGQPGEEGCYAGSKLFVEQQLARYTDWTPTAIEMRRREIFDWAMTRWHVDTVEEAFDGQAETALDTIQRVVTRMFIPRGQMLLYKALYEAGQDGVPYDELYEKMGVRKAQLLGILGALGNRINQTEGLKSSQPGTALLLQWSSIDDVGIYAMRPGLRTVIESLPKLHKIVAGWSVVEIDSHYRAVWNKDWRSQRADLDLPNWT